MPFSRQLVDFLWKEERKDRGFFCAEMWRPKLDVVQLVLDTEN